MRSFAEPAPNLDGAQIMVTGGTGSFGRQFLAQICRNHRPKRVVIYSRDEMKQYELAQRYPPEQWPFLRFFIGDVRDRDRLEMAMHNIDYVIHAAALKHITAAEYNPFECIHTNVVGAENVVQASVRAGVKKVIALSTDKAANPVNLYGASKLASDKIFVAANSLSSHSATRFAVVRYGNVFGSRGSVAPLFHRLKAEGATTLPITDPRMTRFSITLEQGVNFVLSSLAMMEAGGIYVPKIPSMKVVDLARAVAPELDHCIVGIRPGEKLHEVMITVDDGRNTLELDDRYIIAPAFPFWLDKHANIKGARPVPEEFTYTSDANDEWLDRDALTEMLVATVYD